MFVNGFEDSPPQEAANPGPSGAVDMGHTMTVYLKPCCCLLLAACGTLLGEVSTRVCRPDMQTCLEYRVDPDSQKVRVYDDIMVGTHLMIVVSSDAATHWNGALAIENEHRLTGLLTGRNYNPLTEDWEESRLPAASERARVYTWIQAGIAGFALEGHSRAVDGDWFIIDYTAIDEGPCRVKFYDWYASEPLRWEFQFTHVPTRDFNLDTRVDFSDFAFLAYAAWESDAGGGPLTEMADLNADGVVDMEDTALFCQFWLETTE